MKKTLIYKILSGLFTTILILTTGFLIYSLFLFSNIETFFRIMASILLILLTITLVYSLINAVKHKRIKTIIFHGVNRCACRAASNGKRRKSSSSTPHSF